MARKPKSESKKTGLYYAREARRMSRSQLVKRSGVSKQQLSRLENGLIRLRLDHLKPFANALGYSPEQILLWAAFLGLSAISPRLKLSAQVSRSPNWPRAQKPTTRNSKSAKTVVMSTASSRKAGYFLRAS